MPSHHIHTWRRDASTGGIRHSMKALAQNVRCIQIPNSGHWGPEERPDFVLKMLDHFFAGNSTKTSK
jgi:pimeloyl-ACP methyl ester carboxylesterase